MQVGARLKSLRIGQGLTVGALAEQTSLSKGLISQIENDKVSPSLASLERLAQGLSVPVAYLLLRPADAIQVMRANQRPVYRVPVEGGRGPDQLRVEVLYDGSRNLKAALIELPPGTVSGCDSHAHPGEEFHLVLEGRVRAMQAEQAVDLDTGDAWHWHGCTPHRVANIGEGTARLLVITSASMAEGVGMADSAG